jgi:hypothetical protein
MIAQGGCAKMEPSHAVAGNHARSSYLICLEELARRLGSRGRRPAETATGSVLPVRHTSADENVEFIRRHTGQRSDDYPALRVRPPTLGPAPRMGTVEAAASSRFVMSVTAQITASWM